MALLAADGRNTSGVASQEHTAIILPLLLLLGSVMLIGVLWLLVIRRYLRAHQAGRSGGAGRQPRVELRANRFFQSSVFQCPNRWVAVRSTQPQAVQAALGLHNPTPCSWTDGMARVSDQKLFISP